MDSKLTFGSGADSAEHGEQCYDVTVIAVAAMTSVSD